MVFISLKSENLAGFIDHNRSIIMKVFHKKVCHFFIIFVFIFALVPCTFVGCELKPKMSEEVSRLKEKLAVQQHEIKTLRDQLKEAQESKVKALTNTEEAIQARNQALKEKKEVEKRAMKLANQLQRAQRKIIALEMQVKEIPELKAQLEARPKPLEPMEVFISQRKEIAGLRSELQQCHQEVSELKTKIQELEQVEKPVVEPPKAEKEAVKVKEEKVEKKLTNSAELALVDTSGNTDTRSLNFNNALTYKFKAPYQFTWKFETYRDKQEDKTTAERYLSNLKLDWLYSPRLFFFGYGGWEKDRFAGIRSRYTFGPGLGYKVMERQKSKLTLEIGPTYTREDYVGTGKDKFITGRGYGIFEYKLRNRILFTQDAEWLSNFEKSRDYRVVTNTSLQIPITNIFSMKTGYRILYDHDPPPGFTATDKILTTAIVMTY